MFLFEGNQSPLSPIWNWKTFCHAKFPLNASFDMMTGVLSGKNGKKAFQSQVGNRSRTFYLLSSRSFAFKVGGLEQGHCQVSHPSSWRLFHDDGWKAAWGLHFRLSLNQSRHCNLLHLLGKTLMLNFDAPVCVWCVCMWCVWCECVVCVMCLVWVCGVCVWCVWCVWCVCDVCVCVGVCGVCGVSMWCVWCVCGVCGECVWCVCVVCVVSVWCVCECVVCVFGRWKQSLCKCWPELTSNCSLVSLALWPVNECNMCQY